MASTFAWLDHSESDRRKALDVVDLFREQDTRDELGIGTVRDALADSLFPGISTIQTRAKYLLFIPWIYQALEAGRTKSSDVARLARRHEIDLIYQLLKSDDTDGVIGKDAKAGLQRLPSSVYWAGLGVFGIRRYQGSLDQYHRSLDGFYLGRRQVHASAEDGIVELFKPQTNWHEGLPAAPDGFPEGASLQLREEEAEYLHQQIMTNVPGTLIAFLVDQGEWWDAVSFPWHHPQVGECASHVKAQLHHAELFSLIMLGAALLYNLMLAEKRASSGNDGAGSPEGLVGHYRNALDDWYGEVEDKRRTLDRWVESRSDFWEVIHRVNPRIPIPTVHFINTWTDIALSSDGIDTLIGARAARDLIHHRERRLKRALARLDNPRALEMWSGAAGTQQLSYRWQQVQTIVQDILRGLGRGQGIVLAPKDRTLLLESLRPPPGFHLDAAVSTTYSLDLMALLVAPLAFTFFDWEGDDGQPTKDPNALLEALRRHVDRIHVFCQAGQIAVPKTYRLLFGYLESSVHEVRAVRDGGVFHPKVWIVRYVADGEPAQYRLLCASRNLTFDRSWDTLLVLDGVVGKESTKKNEPLSRFIRSLQEMAVQELTDNTKNTLAELARELDAVEFQLPDHIENIEFWPIGLPGEQDVWPFPDSADRGLVIAPFVAEGTLSRLNISGEQTLVSRVDELQAIDPDQIGEYEIFALSEGADIEQEEGVEPDEGSDTGSLLSGLHAKLFAFDDSGIGRVWTGSANATNAAFHQNVEFLVEMQGQSKHMGVEAILCPQQKGISVLRDLLEPFSPGEEGGADSAQQVLENLLQRLRRFVVDLELVVQAEPLGQDSCSLSVREI